MRCKEMRASVRQAEKRDPLEELTEEAARISRSDYPKYYCDPHGVTWRKASRAGLWKRVE